MLGTPQVDGIVLTLRSMTLLEADDAPKVELLSDQDQHRTYKVSVDGRALLVRVASQGACAAAHLYATTATRHVPDLRPKVLAYDVERGILVEEWLDPGEYKSLAQELLEEPASYGWSTPFGTDESSGIDLQSLLHEIGEKIGRVHAGTRGFAQSGSDAKAPAMQARPFEACLRAARAHPHLASRLRRIAEQSARVEPVLLHGSLSPRSVLFSEEHVAIISAEHAAPGDPAFDLAHMMAHLFVVSVHRGSSILLEAAGYFHWGYARMVETLDKPSIMHRAGPLSVALMLAFLEDEQAGSLLTAGDRQLIVDFSQWWLGRRDYTLGQVRDALWDAVDAGGVIDWRAQFESLPRADE